MREEATPATVQGARRRGSAGRGLVPPQHYPRAVSSSPDIATSLSRHRKTTRIFGALAGGLVGGTLTWSIMTQRTVLALLALFVAALYFMWVVFTWSRTSEAAYEMGRHNGRWEERTRVLLSIQEAGERGLAIEEWMESYHEVIATEARAETAKLGVQLDEDGHERPSGTRG